MDEKKYSNARRAIGITTTLTVLVAIFELLIAFSQYKSGMTIGDVGTYVTNKRHIYLMLLIIANLSLLPGALLLYKENKISLRDEIFDKKTLGKDIAIGIGAFIVSEILGDVYGYLIDLIPGIGTTELARQGKEMGINVAIMEIIALVIVSGIVKEIYFRGLARRFCGSVFGEMPALLLFNVLFALLDWFNLGVSFVAGLVWLLAYRKTKHLITPMICHCLSGLLFFIFALFTY